MTVPMKPAPMTVIRLDFCISTSSLYCQTTALERELHHLTPDRFELTVRRCFNATTSLVEQIN